MSVIFLIARDSVRALLHQRLLIGLMLVSLAMTIFFSVIMSRTRDTITSQFTDSEAATNSAAFKNMSEEDKKNE